LFAAALIGLAAVCLGALASPGRTEKYRQDAKGLEKQFEPFIKAYEKGDERAQEEAFKIFQIPSAKEWFSGYFRDDDVQQLVWDAESETEHEGKTLRKMMDILAQGGRFHAHCQPSVGSRTGSVKERQSSVQSLKPVPVEQYEVEIVDDKSGKKFSWLGNFVFVDGAYRFVGGGALPFWSMPDANDPAKKQ
jgi:hypothetical protein